MTHSTTIPHDLYSTAVETPVDVQLLRHSPDITMAAALSNHTLLVNKFVDQANDKGWRVISVDTRWFNILDALQNPRGDSAEIRTVLVAREK